MRRITKGNNTNQNETNRRKAFSRYHTTYVTIFYHWPMSRLNSQLIITCCDNVVTIRCALDSWYIQLPPESAGSDSQYSRLQWEVIWMWSNSLWISIKMKRERKKLADSSPLCHMNTANRSTPEFISSRHSGNNLYNTVSNCDIIICTAWNLFSALYKNISLLSSLNTSQLLLLLLLLTRHCAKPNWNLVCDSTNPLFQIWASSKRTWNWNRLISESD